MPPKEQIRKGKEFFRYKTGRGLKYLAYFQSYSNTYGDFEKLKRYYLEALEDSDILGIIIATRPDCMTDEMLAFLKELSNRTFVFIEYGVESTNNETLARINRGHTYEDAVDTIKRTHAVGLLCGVHMIIGLPQETEEDFIQHIHKLNPLPITALKFHQLQILKGTQMAKEYAQAPEAFTFYTPEEYQKILIHLLRLLSPHKTIHRFTSQAPKDLLIAPKWDIKNYIFTNSLVNKMLELGVRQGDLYEAK